MAQRRVPGLPWSNHFRALVPVFWNYPVFLPAEDHAVAATEGMVCWVLVSKNTWNSL